MHTTQNNIDSCEPSKSCSPPLTHFYIYENLDLISDCVFDQEEITIGSSREADLFLDHQSVAEIHALVHHSDDQVFLTNKYPQNGLRLNGRAVGLAELQHEDVIDIGPFSLKIKMTMPEVKETSEDSESYVVRLVNRYGSSQAMQTAAGQLSKLLKADRDRVLPLLAREHFILKRGLSGIEAARVQNTLLTAGVVCDVQLEESTPSASVDAQSPEPKPPEPKPMDVQPASSAASTAEPPAPEPMVEDPEPPVTAAADLQVPEPLVDEPAPPLTVAAEPPAPEPVVADKPLAPEPVVDAPPVLETAIDASAAGEPTQSADKTTGESALSQAFDVLDASKEDEYEAPEEIHVSFTELFEDELDEDEDEEIWEAPFSLKGTLEDAKAPKARAQKLPEQLQVVKTIGQSVVDVRYLSGRQKYYIPTKKGRFCLAGAKGDGFVSLLPEFNGYIQSSSGEAKADLESYKTPEFLLRQKKSIYRIPLPDGDAVVVEAGGSRYRIGQVQAMPSAHVTVAPRPSDFSWRHWATSAGTHFVLLLCLTVFMYFQADPAKKQAPHFVKIDPSLLQKLQAPKELPKPKPPPPPPPKPEPVKVAKKVKPKKKPPKKKAPPPKVAKSRKTRKKGVRTAQVSKSPKAGGGFGEGNIKNRNIKQTGILSVLGNKSLGGPSQAIASVTNLDAVAVPGASKKNFTVGGLKGALGNGKIAVASGQIIQTKSSNMVLRSAGARGKGTVAALERGTTGKKKVRSMVTAKMTRTVKIEGGMSREMVKRVIDQHLEEITFCYETALMSNPAILGRIVFEWKILMSGRVGEIRIVASSVNSHELHDCIKSAIKSWQFPKPVGAEVVVSYPFVFDLVTF